MKRILLDCDGVLADFVGAYLEIINEKFGTAFGREQVTEFDVAKSLGMSAASAAMCKRAIGEARGFARNLDVYPGAIQGVRRLRAIADVYIVTSPWNSNPTWTHDREAWLKDHFDIPHKRVVHTSAKHLVAGDMLVDDKTSACDEWRAAWPAGVAVQWSTPHNRLDLWDGQSTSDWAFLVEILRSMPS